MEISRLTRDGTAEPVSRDQILRHARGQGNIIFPVQLTTSRIGNLTRLIHTLLYVMTIRTYILVNASHQLALITSLPFVHTARRTRQMFLPLATQSWPTRKCRGRVNNKVKRAEGTTFVSSSRCSCGVACVACRSPTSCAVALNVKLDERVGTGTAIGLLERVGTGIVGTIGYVVLPTGVSTDVSRDIV